MLYSDLTCTHLPKHVIDSVTLPRVRHNIFQCPTFCRVYVCWFAFAVFDSEYFNNFLKEHFSVFKVFKRYS